MSQRRFRALSEGECRDYSEKVKHRGSSGDRDVFPVRLWEEPLSRQGLPKKRVCFLDVGYYDGSLTTQGVPASAGMLCCFAYLTHKSRAGTLNG